MDTKQEQRRRQIMLDILDEPYLTEQQQQQLRAVVNDTEKLEVLDTTEDLLVRLFTQRAENYVMIVRKVQQAIRFESRQLDKADENKLHVSEEQEASALLGNLSA